MPKIKIFIPLILIFITTGCGFKVVNKNQINNFDVNNIITTGDKRINYKIKNKLLFNSKRSGKNLIDIYLDTLKIKEIKEKNIKNEITKYEITIRTNVKLNELTRKNEVTFSITKNGSYSVAEQHSQTRNSEKKLVEILVNSISKAIINETSVRLNDL